MSFEEPPHGGAAIEAAAGIAFQRFADDRGQRLDPLQHFPAARRLFVLITDRSLEHPEAVERPRVHPVQRLLAILLALVLGDTREKMLDELAVGILAEFDRG